MIKKLFWIFSLSLILALFPSAIAAQSNCPDADDETEVVSAEPIEGEIEEDENAWFYFEASPQQAWRFDVFAEDELSFYFFDPEVSSGSRLRDGDEFFWITTDAREGDYAGLFLSGWEGVYCLRVSNDSNAEIAYEFTLSNLVEDRNGRLVGAEELSFAGSYNNRGHYYWSKGNYELALESYLEALELEPDNPVLWGNACSAAYNAGSYEDALDYCDEALDIDDEDIFVLDYRSVTYSALGDYEAALEDLELLEELEPNNPNWPLNIGFTYIMLGDADEALEAMDNHVELSGEPLAYYWRGLANLYAGEFEDAIDDFETDIDDSASPSPFGYTWLGVAYLLDGDEDAAEDAFAEAASLAEEADTEILQLRQLALLALATGDEDEALANYEQLLALDAFAHRRRSDLLYLTMLAELFDDDMYSDMLEWFREEIGLD